MFKATILINKTVKWNQITWGLEFSDIPRQKQRTKLDKVSRSMSHMPCFVNAFNFSRCWLPWAPILGCAGCAHLKSCLSWAFHILTKCFDRTNSHCMVWNRHTTSPRCRQCFWPCSKICCGILFNIWNFMISVHANLRLYFQICRIFLPSGGHGLHD